MRKTRIGLACGIFVSPYEQRQGDGDRGRDDDEHSDGTERGDDSNHGDGERYDRRPIDEPECATDDARDGGDGGECDADGTTKSGTEWGRRATAGGGQCDRAACGATREALNRSPTQAGAAHGPGK